MANNNMWMGLGSSQTFFAGDSNFFFFFDLATLKTSCDPINVKIGFIWGLFDEINPFFFLNLMTFFGKLETLSLRTAGLRGKYKNLHGR